MKRFEQSEIVEALAHAAAGGQALYLYRQRRSLISRHRDMVLEDCWCRAAQAGEQVAHLYDQDASRLREMARTSLRVCVRGRIEGQGTPRQRLRLCGGPLLTALAMCW